MKEYLDQEEYIPAQRTLTICSQALLNGNIKDILPNMGLNKALHTPRLVTGLRLPIIRSSSDRDLRRRATSCALLSTERNSLF